MKFVFSFERNKQFDITILLFINNIVYVLTDIR